MKIALIVPPGYSVAHAQFNLERVGLGYVAAPLRAAGHTVRIFDGIIDSLTWDSLYAGVDAFSPRIVGVSLMSHHSLPQARLFLARVRGAHPDAHVCLGGTFPSLNWRQLLTTLPEADSIACGEGEGSLLGLAAALQDGTPVAAVPGLAVRGDDGPRFTPADVPIDLDELMWPARDQIETVLGRGGPATLISSRGCYARCTFCAIEAVTRALYPRPMRYRSAVDVVNELEALHRRHGVRRFYFVDENFMGPGAKGRERAQAIAHEIVSRRLQITFSLECRCMDVEEETFRALTQAGLQRVFVGVESVDQEELTLFRKAQDRRMIDKAIGILRGLDLHVEIGYVLFTPWSTLDKLRDKRRFLETFGPDATASLGSYLSIMPGTAIEQSLRAEGLLSGSWPEHWFEFRDRASSILFGLVQRELVEPWNGVIESLLGHHWNRPFDWSMEHALARDHDDALAFVSRLLAWSARERLQIFDMLFSVVERLELPGDADAPPAWALEALRVASERSRRSAAEAQALLRAVAECGASTARANSGIS